LVAHLQASHLDAASVARRIEIDMRNSARLLEENTAPIDERLEKLLVEFMLPILRAANCSRADSPQADWGEQLAQEYELEPFVAHSGDRFESTLHEALGTEGGDRVSVTRAPGYRLRGKVLLRAVVSTGPGLVPASHEGGVLNKIRIASGVGTGPDA
jgi:hypothetical protein